MMRRSSSVYSIGFAAGGKEVVTLSGSGLFRWDAATGKQLAGPLGPPQEEGLPRFALARVSADGTPARA